MMKAKSKPIPYNMTDEQLVDELRSVSNNIKNSAIQLLLLEASDRIKDKNAQFIRVEETLMRERENITAMKRQIEIGKEMVKNREEIWRMVKDSILKLQQQFVIESKQCVLPDDSDAFNIAYGKRYATQIILQLFL